MAGAIRSSPQCAGCPGLCVGIRADRRRFWADRRVLASLLPPALFWVSKLIIDTIFRILTTHQPAGRRLWWLVAAEFVIAVAMGILSRIRLFWP